MQMYVQSAHTNKEMSKYIKLKIRKFWIKILIYNKKEGRIKFCIVENNIFNTYNFLFQDDILYIEIWRSMRLDGKSIDGVK